MLQRQIEKDLHSLRRAYTKALRAHDDTTMGEWLCDNFYLLEREGRDVLSQLKTAPALPLDSDNVRLQGPGVMSFEKSIPFPAKAA